ncbi:hypothetical protein ACWGJ2_30770 [Streptomyces sp. NPDC054796]
MRIKRSVIGVLAVLAWMLAAALAAGPAQAATSSEHADGGTVLTLPPAPDDASAARSAAVSPTITPEVRTEHGQPGNDYVCPAGNLCTVVWDPTTSDYKVFFLYTCQKYALSDWEGTGNYWNGQTGNVTSYFYGQSGNVLKSFQPDAANHAQDWSPVWSIRNC